MTTTKRKNRPGQGRKKGTKPPKVNLSVGLDPDVKLIVMDRGGSSFVEGLILSELGR